tara:strand:- start:593 stop:1144 length:552 start_codon:yes stop_codon:yes gene_type:complete
MSIYSGSSPFARGKLNGNRLAGARTMGAKLSRGGAKKRITQINRRRNSNRVRRTGTAAVSKGTLVLGMTNSGNGLIKNANAFSMSTTSGALSFDALGSAARGTAIAYVSCTCGTDFASASAAFADKKNIKITLQIDGVDYDGILDQDSLAGRNYKIGIPTITAINSSIIENGDATALNIDFTT